VHRFLAGLLLSLLLAGRVQAAEVIVFATNPFTPVFADLLPSYTAGSGNKVTIVRDTAGGLAKRILAGERFDLALVNQSAVADLAARGRIDPATQVPVARSGIGLAVPDGAPVPDVSTVEGFVGALLAARAVAYTDPAAGGSSGIYLAGLFQRLGIAEALRPKTVLVPGGLAAERLVTGEATVALQQSAELMAVKGAHFAGPIPANLQNYAVYTAVIAASAEQPDAARAVLALLTGPEGTAALARHGLDRP